jgi:hypothetical protein
MEDLSYIDPSSPTLRQSLANVLRGMTKKEEYQQMGQGIQNTAQVMPSVLESLARGGIAQVPGTVGDISQTAREFFPQTMQSTFGNRQAPTTEEILDYVPRINPNYEGSQSHEMIGGLIGPALGKMLKMGAEASKGLKGGLSIEDVSNKIPNLLRQQITDFDPRFDPRKLEQEKLKNLTTTIEQNKTQNVPSVSLVDYEGRPFITSMSDRTAAGGKLIGINDVNLKRPVDLMGGQDYMFNNPGQVWASAQSPVKQLMKNAQVLREVTGQDPLYLPWRMAPSGGDFAHMTGETMLSYAESAMSKSQKKALNNEIKTVIPNWKGIDSPESIAQYRELKDSRRKFLKKQIDKMFRDENGLGIGEARLSITDPKQLVGQDAGIMNVGEIFADKPMIMQSGHPSYPRGLPGQGLGRLKEDRNIFELLPNVVKERGILMPTSPRQTDIRALQMKPYAGIIDDKLLKSLGY